MSLIRRLDTHHKLYASFALLLCLSMGLSLWMLGRLEQMSLLTAGPAQKLSGLAVQAQAGYAGARLLAWVAIGVTLGATAMLGLWLRAEFARPVRQAAAMARRMAAGDLSGRSGVVAAGEAGAMLDSMQEMNDSLAGMIVRLRAGTEGIAGSAGQIAAGSAALASRSNEQAASLALAGALIAQLGAGAGQNAEHAHLAGTLARSASEVASEGAAVAAEAAASMEALSHSSRRIAAITGVIDAIAVQATVLALNAEVEAARAGEPGRGFTTIAAEVRGLAQRSTQVAREIRLLIDDAMAKAGAGVVLADKAGQALHDAAASAKRMTAVAGDIADASAGQAQFIEQAGQLMAAIDQASRDSAGRLAQSAAAAAAMRDQADSLSRTTAAFVLGPQHGAVLPAIRLVSNNQLPLLRRRPIGDLRNSHAPAPAVVTLAPVPKRSHGAFASHSMDREEF